MPTVSAQWDIKSLIEHFANIQVAGRPATVHGVLEYHSNCPWCGGTDRFITEPETGRYSCAIRSSGCGRTGDCIDFLKDYKDMLHSEACDFLGIEHNADFIPQQVSKSVQSGKEYPPCKGWQESGKMFVERAVAGLWSPMGQDMLDYLHGRGLEDGIIKKKKLGYVPLQKNGRFYEAELEQWGLTPEEAKKDKVRVPDGILIPWFEGSTLWRLAIKRPGQSQSYGQVVGSGEGLFNVDTIEYDAPCIMTEAELCAMAVEQESGIPCVATGSATRARSNRWLSELNLASYVLQSFDEDEGGDTGADYWMKNLQKCMRWSPYIAKDPNDILMKKYFEDANQCSLREWVERGIESAHVEFGYMPTIEKQPVIFKGSEYIQKEIPPCKVEEPSLFDQWKREGGRLLSRAEAQRVSGEPIKPDFDCFFCHDRRKNRWAWTWSSLQEECICVACFSPASWSERNWAKFRA